MITSTVEVITPYTARGYLEKNTNNYRFLNKEKVHQYAEDIRTGNWVENGESIVFGADGILKDGQHRLAAVVEANKAIVSVVVRGIENGVNLYDMGSNRSIRQIARAEGYVLNPATVAAANIIHAGFHNSGSKGVVKQYVYDHLDELNKAVEIAQRGCAHAAGRKVGCVLAVYGLRRLDTIDDAVLSDFFWVFNNQNIQPGQQRNPSPALVAVKMFSKMNHGASGKTKKVQMGIILQAIKDFRRNRNRTMVYPENDTIVEDMITKLRKADGINCSVF